MKLCRITFAIACTLLLGSVSCTKENDGGDSGGSSSSFTAITAVLDPWDNIKRSELTYEVLIYSFADSNGDGIGDLRGVMSKLDYIEALGATAIWLSPVHPSDSYHGYDVTDYTAINPAYGTMEDFEALVAAAHERGIRIYLDYVLNHTGKGHPWFVAARSSLDNAFRDYYIFSRDPQSDIRNGQIPMMSDLSYNAGEWFDVATADSEVKRCKFSLAWGPTPTITVTETDTVDEPNPDTSDQGAKYLWYGDEQCVKFYDKGNSLYEINIDLDSPWGFLIRTSTETWEGGTKFGASPTAGKLSLGQPFTLTSSSPANVVPEWVDIWKCHSNFYTEYMPDINYGDIGSFHTSGPYKALVAAAKGWVDRGVDGFRLDAVKHIYHNSTSTENPTFLKGFYTDLNEYFRATHDHDIYMVGEMYSEYNEVAPYYAALPALFEFSFWNRLSWAINNSTGCYFVKDIIDYQETYSQYRTNFIEATKLSNHDEDRTRTTLGTTLGKAKIAAAILLTAAGSPYVYYGEELGYVGSKMRGDEYVRGPMKWGDAATTTFISNQDSGMSAIADAASQAEDDNSILNVYRRFGQLRNIYPAMSAGAMKPHKVYHDKNAEFKQIAAWYREYEGERFLVLHNLSGQQSVLQVDDAIDKCVAVLENVETRSDSGATVVRMPGYSSVVFRLKNQQ